MTIVIFVFLVGASLIVLGGYCIYSGVSASTEFSFFNVKFKSANVGIAAILIGAALMVLVWGKVLDTVNRGHIAESSRPAATSSINETGVAETKAESTRIVIQLPDGLRQPPLSFGLLYIRNGKDEVSDSGPLINEEIMFKEIDRLGATEAVVNSEPLLGFQFKCFVDHRGVEFDKVKSLLESAGFTNVTRGEGRPFRAWFILPGYPTYRTTDGILNNFYYPA